LPTVLPPTVRAAIKLVITAPTRTVFIKENRVLIEKTIAAPMAPLRVPAISPTTSAVRLATKSALRTIRTAWLAPGIFLAAIALKGTRSAAAAAVPIASDIIPDKITKVRKKKDNKRSWVALIIDSRPKLMIKPATKVKKAIHKAGINMFLSLSLAKKILLD
jgi:hypothetical protein